MEDLERRLALVERKLGLLAATSEEELNGASTVLADAGLLYSQAQYMLKREKSPERAYRMLAALHALHPKSEENKAAYPLAAELFQGLYLRKRHVDPQGVWTTTEPVFMFHWLASFFGEDGSVFPQAQAERLLVGMPVTTLREFEAFAAARPALKRWRLSFEKDNGIVQSISAAPAE